MTTEMSDTHARLIATLALLKNKSRPNFGGNPMSVFADMTDRHQPSVEPSNVTPLRPSNRKIVTDALVDYCDDKHIVGVQQQAVVEFGLTILANGASNAKAIMEGKITADRIHDKMRQIRTRIGTRDDGPQAA
jgi:hypothetical protein